MRLRPLMLLATVPAALLCMIPMTAATAGLMRPAPSQGGSVAAVKIIDFDYVANTTTVDTGTTVTWTNTGGRPHTATDRGGTFDTQPIAPGRSASLSFTVPGSYFYFCRINPTKMNGVIVVRPGADAARVNRIQAVDPANIAGESFRFDPASLTIRAGSSLLVADVGGKPHTLTADDGSFDTGVITPGPEGGRFAGSNTTITVSQPGNYPFHCNIHPEKMKGTLTVEGTATAAAPPPASTAARQVDVKVVDFAFQPPQASVAPGGQVTWANGGQAPHTATFDDIDLKTGTLQPGQKEKLTAPQKPGSYSYHCAIHPAKMHGVLVVVGGAAPDPTKTAAAPQPKVTVKTGGPGGRVSGLVLVTGLLGAFLGGLGIGPFLRRRPPATGD